MRFKGVWYWVVVLVLVFVCSIHGRQLGESACGAIEAWNNCGHDFNSRNKVKIRRWIKGIDSVQQPETITVQLVHRGRWTE